VSADGNEVAFLTLSTNVIPGDPGAGLFLRDRATGGVTRITEQANVGQFEFTPSADGRFVTYETRDPYVGGAEIHVLDRFTNTTQTFARQYGTSIAPIVSADGSTVIFGVNSAPYEWYPRCEAVDLSTGSSTQCPLGATDRVANGIAAISSNGRFVVNLWSSSDNSTTGLVIWDRTNNTVNDLPASVPPGAYTQVLAVSDDGRYLSIYDSSGAGQLDLQTSTVKRPPNNAGAGAYPAATSRDGKYIHLATPATTNTEALTRRWNTRSNALNDLGGLSDPAFAPVPMCSITLVTDGGGVCVNTADSLDPIDDNAKTDAYLID
jgi:Tol biopolymer transport system component